MVFPLILVAEKNNIQITSKFGIKEYEKLNA